jgi:GNAT superfamily N-acetyltransferase
MSDHKITLRTAVEADAGVILRFIRALAEYEKLSHMVVATEQSLREQLFGARPAAETLIASLDGEDAGFALFFSSFSTFLGKPGIYLEDLFVLPAARSKGVGRVLLTEVARIATARNCGRLEWAVLDWNSPTIGFYKKLGAVPMDEWTTYRVTGDVLRRLADE